MQTRKTAPTFWPSGCATTNTYNIKHTKPKIRWCCLCVCIKFNYLFKHVEVAIKSLHKKTRNQKNWNMPGDKTDNWQNFSRVRFQLKFPFIKWPYGQGGGQKIFRGGGEPTEKYRKLAKNSTI